MESGTPLFLAREISPPRDPLRAQIAELPGIFEARLRHPALEGVMRYVLVPFDDFLLEESRQV